MLDKACHVTGLSAGSFLLRAFLSPRAPLLGERRGLLALSVHRVHCHGRLHVVAVVEGRVVWAVVMELVAQQGCSLRWGVQVQVVIMVPHVHPS